MKYSFVFIIFFLGKISFILSQCQNQNQNLEKQIIGDWYIYTTFYFDENNRDTMFLKHKSIHKRKLSKIVNGFVTTNEAKVYYSFNNKNILTQIIPKKFNYYFTDLYGYKKGKEMRQSFKWYAFESLPYNILKMYDTSHFLLHKDKNCFVLCRDNFSYIEVFCKLDVDIETIDLIKDE